jgi:hypothetical protein
VRAALVPLHLVTSSFSDLHRCRNQVGLLMGRVVGGASLGSNRPRIISGADLRGHVRLVVGVATGVATGVARGLQDC